MRRSYTAQIIRFEDKYVYLNIDQGFQTWKIVKALYLNRGFLSTKNFKRNDWVVVSIYQRKYPAANFERRYEYEAVVVSKTTEPTQVFSE